MPVDCTLFRRFQSEISNHYAANVQWYIEQICHIFTCAFPDGDELFQYWNDGAGDDCGAEWTWEEANRFGYEQLDKVGRGKVQAFVNDVERKEAGRRAMEGGGRVAV